jgi:hypothetical protein
MVAVYDLPCDPGPNVSVDIGCFGDAPPPPLTIPAAELPVAVSSTRLEKDTRAEITAFAATRARLRAMAVASARGTYS